MVLLRTKDIAKMTQEDRETKLKELKFALVKGAVTANKSAAKTKEVKKAIARLLSYQNYSKSTPKGGGEKN